MEWKVSYASISSERCSLDQALRSTLSNVVPRRLQMSVKTDFESVGLNSKTLLLCQLYCCVLISRKLGLGAVLEVQNGREEDFMHGRK